jgi:hypothetical protein
VNAVKGKKGFVSAPLTERFWSRVDRRGPDECWPWTGAHDGKGRGLISKNGRSTRAPRVSWELENGKPIPDHLDACHSCDNPNCVNPSHIWPGTPSQNAMDAIQKGRYYQVSLTEKSYNREKTHCLKGHEYTAENTLIYGKTNKRRCRVCTMVSRQIDNDGRRAKRARAALEMSGGVK